MKAGKYAAALALAALVLSVQRAVAQANVIENQGVSIYVDASHGSDLNDGALSRPLQSIAAAISLADSYASRGVGVRVELQPGIYRESVQIGAVGHNPTLTLEGSQSGSSVIDGADVYTGWRQTGNPSIYTHDFSGLGSNPIPGGWSTKLPKVVYRREMVFVNGAPLTQVMQSSQMQAGTFYVDDGAHQLLIWPMHGTDMSSAEIEVAVRPYLLSVAGRNNVVIRGVTLLHSAGYMNDAGAKIYGSDNVLLDSIKAEWNNWGGIGVYSTDHLTLENSTASYNGGEGVTLAKNKNIVVKDSRADYNNWRGAMGGFYDWAMGGFKFLMTHGATVSHVSAYNNGAEGLWFDTDNRQISIDSSNLSGNNDANLQLEVNYGPISVTNTGMCFGTLGANLVNSENVTFSNDAFYGNGQGPNTLKSQFFLAGKAGGRSFRDWETGEYHNVISKHIHFDSDAFEDTSAGHVLFGTYLPDSDWRTFADTLSSSSNSWYDPTTSNAFELPGGNMVDFSGWKSATGQDGDSRWASTGAPSGCKAPTAEFADIAVYATTIWNAASYHASNGKISIPLRVKNYGTGDSVTLSMLDLPDGIQANFSPSTLADADQGSSADAMSTLTLSSSGYSGTAQILILAKSGTRVRTLQFPVTF